MRGYLEHRSESKHKANHQPHVEDFKRKANVQSSEKHIKIDTRRQANHQPHIFTHREACGP